MGGSTEYAPQALYDLFDLIKSKIPSAQNGGIKGNAAHTYGYHRGRNFIPASDYSVRESKLDREGDGNACSALDVTLGSGALMRTVSKRLMAAKNDKRMYPVREFFGTTDGVNVSGWDWLGNCWTTSDDMSHLWHVHLSIHRKYANDLAALKGVADVMAGTNGDDDLTKDELLDILNSAQGQAALRKAVWDYPIEREKGGPKYLTRSWLTAGGTYAAEARNAANALRAPIAGVQAAIAKINPGNVVVDTRAVVTGVVAGIKSLSWKVGA